MQPSLRETLADTHIAAVAIAVLLLSSLDSGFRALWPPLPRTIEFVVTAIAIRGVPYISPTFTVADWLTWGSAGAYFVYALICLAVAWLVSRWVYGVGPVQGLRRYGARLARRSNA